MTLCIMFDYLSATTGSGDTGYCLSGVMRIQAVQGSTWYDVATSAEYQSVRYIHGGARLVVRRTGCSRTGVSVTDCDRLGGSDRYYWPLSGSLSTVGCCRVENSAMCAAHHSRRRLRSPALQHSYILREQGRPTLPGPKNSTEQCQQIDDINHTHTLFTSRISEGW